MFLEFSDVVEKLALAQRFSNQRILREVLNNLYTAISTTRSAIQSAVSTYNSILQSHVNSSGQYSDLTPDNLKYTVNAGIDTTIESINTLADRNSALITEGRGIPVPVEVSAPEAVELVGKDPDYVKLLFAANGIIVDKEGRVWIIPSEYLHASTNYATYWTDLGWTGSTSVPVSNSISTPFAAPTAAITGNKICSFFRISDKYALCFQSNRTIHLVDISTNTTHEVLSGSGDTYTTGSGEVDMTGTQPVLLSDVSTGSIYRQQYLTHGSSGQVGGIQTMPVPSVDQFEFSGAQPVRGDITLADVIESSVASPSRIRDIATALEEVKYSV